MWFGIGIIIGAAFSHQWIALWNVVKAKLESWFK